ncbi:MAG: hypothetical protein ACYC27_15710 [Armatimonadota bacterium]
MRAGYAKIEITPQWELELAGYGYYRQRVHKGVHDPLKARALALESDGARWLLISCDLVGLGEPLVQRIKNGIAQSIGISVEAVMLCCTHTHSGPATAFLRGCGEVDPRYVEWMQPRLVDAGLDALTSMSEVAGIEWSESDVQGVGFNRVYGDAGPLDNAVRSLTIRRADDRPIIVVNYACHPVANGVNDMVSADFPGYTMKHVEDQGIDCLYISGFCGDVDPLGERNYDLIQAHGQTVANAALESTSNAESLDGSDLSFGIRQIRLPYDIPSRPELMTSLRSERDRLESNPGALDALCGVSWITDALTAADDPSFVPHTDTYVQALSIGNVVILGFPGEVFTAFGLDIREHHPDLKLMTANTANGAIGYIPTADEFDRQGYASHAAAHIYGTFTFHKGFGEKIAKKADRLVQGMKI